MKKKLRELLGDLIEVPAGCHACVVVPHTKLVWLAYVSGVESEGVCVSLLEAVSLVF